MKKMDLVVVVVFALFLVGGCTSEDIEKVDVYEMESFTVIKEGSLTSYTDPEVVGEFVNAFKKAKKEPGVVEMIEPEYKAEIGEESYYLWICTEYGTIMNLEDSHTTYTLSKKSAKKIFDLLVED
ncbi:hypothetical protein [Jeotgalibacillus salarius]|uniref:YhfM-like domain-containing protein n=1 Tax=Jeotgalibacillus salarius TaxID=546023 RepID=A0A4Y8L2T3_9BACL|nr:hypothetical protein [Jeotgalibacillus salarius]TFD96965.1 hypothetical protein E2626_16835 [Jeotgalibacillus salarius]